MAALVWACLLCLATTARAETIHVTTSGDPPIGSSVCPGSSCSLRQAVAVSKSGDTIQLAGTESAPVNYLLTLGSQIEVTHSLTIAGDGVNASRISGFSNQAAASARWSRILKVAGPETSVRIEGLTLIGGLDENDENCPSGCATLLAHGGGALFNAGGKVQLSNVELERNGTETSGQPVGGGVATEGGTLEMVDVTFREDRATFGGGLFAHGGVVTGNRVAFESEGNGSSDGGAVFLYRGASVRLENTTVSGSGWVSGVGGGIDNSSGTLTLINDTLADNTRGSLETDGGSRTIVQNTVFGSGFSDGIDLDCVAAGKENAAGGKTANPITEDLGNNIDQDGACGLSQASDHAGVDPKLAPAASNGGAVDTMALLAGSPALEHGNPKACPATDARTVKRPQGATCDIGSFEAVLKGKPSATTEAASGIGMERATLRGSINLAGEAGGYHFLWGTSSGALENSTPEDGAGVVGSNTPAESTLGGLKPSTTYFYELVADNATGSATGEVRQLKTTSEENPPTIEKVKVAKKTADSATVEFTIDPHGGDTTYEILYGKKTPGEKRTEAEGVGSEPGNQRIVRTLEGLEPETKYVLAISALSPVTDGVRSEEVEFRTEPPPKAPTVSEVKVATVGSSTAKLEFAINPDGADTTYQIEYGTDEKREQKTGAVDIGEERTVQHLSAELTGLKVGTTYHFVVAAFNSLASKGVRSEDKTFKTEAGKPVISKVEIGTVTDTTAQLEFSIDPNGAATSYLIEYGTNVKYEQRTRAAEIGPRPGAQHLAQKLEGLAPNTDYHFAIVAENANAPAGVTSTDETFTTFGAPIVSDVSVVSTTDTTATIAFAIEAAGLPTSYVIEYGATSQYGLETTPESVGAEREAVHLTRTLSGLEAGHTYHFAVVASNQDAVAGERSADLPFTTATQAGGQEVLGSKEGQLPPPALGRTFNVEPVSGTVYVELPPAAAASSLSLAAGLSDLALPPIAKGRRFIPLTEARQLPFGSVLEATAGVAKITTATATAGKVQVGDFGAGVFKLLQSRRQRGLTQLNIIDNRPRRVCATLGKKAASAAKLSSKLLGRLHGSAHGKYVTRGHYSSATVRGTIWTVSDQCNGTLTKVTRHTVLVRDFRRRRTITLHTGQSYLARAGR